MATRVHSSPKLLKNLRSFIRPLNSATSSSSAAVSPLNFGDKPDLSTVEKHHTTTTTPLDFDDHQKLFASVSTSKLLRSSFNLGLVSNETFLDLGMWVMNSRLIQTPLLRHIILKTVKHTFFQQFCAGETPEEAAECLRKIQDAGLRSMLIYAAEHTSDNAGCDRNLEGFFYRVLNSPSRFRLHL
ncbi:hypothetical protein HRI_000282100 [Hibiscus trionum]|uniref:Proline dehydrogenase n=1 Tax=Hibiscus trionum TaxID=183268 RepID=A0A9W7GX24_HIBTR|nr:hypothetical protein HRI_000282100 [Hibiscus trionum]